MLRLLIPSSWPVTNTSCAWALCDEHGRLLQSGFSDPRTWPAADDCEVVLTAEQCLCLYAQVPAKARKLNDEVVVLSLEDHLLGDISDEHWCVGRADENGKIPVWLVRRQRLTDVLEALRQLGRTVQRVVWEVQLLPYQADHWSVAVMAERGMVRTDANRGYAFDMTAAVPPVELLLDVTASRRSDQLPLGVDVVIDDKQAQDLEAWEQALGVPCKPGVTWDWRTASLARANNFLTGTFAPKSAGRALNRFRPALWVLGAALGIAGLALVIESFWLGQREHALRQEVTSIYQRSFPGNRPILDPFAQLQADAGRLANLRGDLASNDFLSLLAALSVEAPPGLTQPLRIRYENRQLRLEFATPPKDTAALVSALQRRGLSAQSLIEEGRPSVIVVRGAQ
jgi:general secretion pathway protein L